jgi:hypothetical protein
VNATLGGLTFVGDGSAATYTLEKLDGWFGGVEMRREMIPRPNSDGDFDSPGYLGGRVITLSGLILAADDAAAFETAMMALEDLLADGSMAEFAVTQAGGTYTAQVRRHGAPDIDASVLYGSVGRYQVQLWAPDPSKVLLP